MAVDHYIHGTSHPALPIRLSQSRRWWLWTYYINPLSYSLYGLIGSQLADIHDEFLDGVNGVQVR